MNCVPIGNLANDDAAERRKALAEALRRGEEISVSASGTVLTEEEKNKNPNEQTMQVPEGKLANDDAAERRKALAEALRRGEEISVSASGTVLTEEEKNKNPNEQTMQVPEGKLAKSIYWYENDKELLAGEVRVMQKFYPSFKLLKMSDGRLYWRGKVQPTGKGGSVWDLMVIYDNNHPYTDGMNTYGGSIDVYPVSPNLADMQNKLGDVKIPHIYWKNDWTEAYICTVRANEFKAGARSSSAGSCLSWACKWIVVFELWLNGDIPFEEFDTEKHVF